MSVTSKLVIVFFTRPNGAPAIGLTPSVDIWEITPTTNTLVVNDAAVSEVGGGFYKYNFTSYNYTLGFGFVIDGEAGGGSTLGTGRYAVGLNDSFHDDVAFSTWEEPSVDHKTPIGSPEVQTFGQLLNLVAAATTGSPPGSPLTIENIVAGVWNEILAGSPAPYPEGSAGGILSQLQLDLQDAVVLIETLIKYEANRTFIDKIAKTLTVYDDDGTTPIRTFSLRDSAGVPSITEIVERLPV